MTYRLRLPLLAVMLFCLTSMMAGCPNNVPGGQFTVVQGTVTNLRTGQPLPGVRIALTSADNSRLLYGDIRDTVLTDAKGAYALSFTNTKGLFYAISCEGPYSFERYRLDFPDSVISSGNSASGEWRRTLDLKIGQTNTANFQVSPRRVVQMQVVTRVTGYQELTLSLGSSYLPADNQNRTLFLYQPVAVTRQNASVFYRTPTALPAAKFMRNRGTGTYRDTTVQAQASTPLTGDTVKASLRFGH